MAAPTIDTGDALLADRLRDLRSKRRMTQRQLADCAGLTQSSIDALERGKRASMRPSTAERLAAALGVSPDVLLPGDPPPPEPEEVISARAAVMVARDKRDAIRTLVGERKVGASALHVADYELHVALKRLDDAVCADRSAPAAYDLLGFERESRS